MRSTKIAFLAILSSALILTGCGGQTNSTNTFHEAYEFSKIENAKADSVKTMLETYYSKSYMEFDRGQPSVSGYEKYRFSYVISMSYGDTTIEQWYDEYGSFHNMGDNQVGVRLEYEYAFTLVDGVRSKGTSVNTLSYELKGDNLRVSVKNGDDELGSFLMRPTNKRVSSYVTDATHASKVGFRYTTDEEIMNKYIISKAYLDDDKNFYFTYYAPYNGTQNCIVKEEGIVTDTITNPDRGSAEDPMYELKITKRTKFFHEEKISEEDINLSYEISTHIDGFGSTNIYLVVNREQCEGMDYYQISVGTHE